MKTVLVVENDSDTLMIYSTVLAHHGYAVLEANDGLTGVALAREHRPDLILMNLSMPQLDGLTATSMIRDEPRTATIPIIACTGFLSEDAEHHAQDAGVNSFLEKPCTPSRIVEEVEKFIGPAVAVGAD